MQKILLAFLIACLFVTLAQAKWTGGCFEAKSLRKYKSGQSNKIKMQLFSDGMRELGFINLRRGAFLVAHNLEVEDGYKVKAKNVPFHFGAGGEMLSVEVWSNTIFDERSICGSSGNRQHHQVGMGFNSAFTDFDNSFASFGQNHHHHQHQSGMNAGLAMGMGGIGIGGMGMGGFDAFAHQHNRVRVHRHGGGHSSSSNSDSD